MKKYISPIILAFILFILIILFIVFPHQEPNFVEINKKKVYVEIAKTQEQKAQGLMFRKSLKENKGMLFIFPDSTILNFWMKNTLIPLDIIFIKENLEISDIAQAAPCTIEPCAIYSSSVPVMYVLEVNSNYTEKNEIKVGQKIVMSQNIKA
jgi:uncharacterized protein